MPTFGRTFRLVCDDTAIPLVESLLVAQGFAFEPEPFFAGARKLTHEPFPLGESLASRFGLIYIQDRSSMLPPLTLAPPKGASVLDMCSAPGSKTSLLSRLVGPHGFVFASEPSADRLGTLRANLRRTGSINAVTAKAMAQDLPFPEQSWEYIQLDPPCSGWGTADKNPKVMDVWSGTKTAPLIALQKVLLEKAAGLLRPGGVVLYSTCTTNIEENEEQVAWALETLDLELEPLSEPEGFVFGAPLMDGMDGVLRVSEDSAGQGFFLARFRKKTSVETLVPEKIVQRELPGTPVRLSRVIGGDHLCLENLPAGDVYNFGGKAFFLPEQALKRVPGTVRWQGFPLGKVAGKGDRLKFLPGGLARILLPSHPEKSQLDILDVDDIAVLEQLFTGRSVRWTSGKGPVGLYYRGLPLGWLSRKGNRLLWSIK
ncbi:RsmB/NOP family class I SAM-dependent RNA methyltransferase [Pseudodesulfovibrio sp. JC047]|uniref:RsmB/NOP family class I SAM-dependent RNA methyltransferase n=1 Tax=Pseudodesulfovibrio sp. JC047 TaxID=2683199 RepID=UPI0013D7239F|nr:RsmB/NOP family class I SAM-dependent RNA methyltransferase [Pseudodesulfovibrio sp. JC047]NDV18605.1 RsmB/NOP family class I SAM-dependent RNA methyltransferase [Pseudodesulfovibrio sp. JC047]